MKELEFVEVLHARDIKEMNRLLLRMFELYAQKLPKEEVADKNVLYISTHTKLNDISRVLFNTGKKELAVDVLHPNDRTVTMYNVGDDKRKVDILSVDEYFKLYGDCSFDVFFNLPNLATNAYLLEYIKNMHVDKLVFSCFKKNFNYSMNALFGERQVKVWKKFTDSYYCNPCKLNYESIDRYYDLPSFCPKCGAEGTNTNTKS